MRLFLLVLSIIFTQVAFAQPYHYRHHSWRLCVDPGNYYYESTQFDPYPGYNYSMGSYYYYPGYYYFEPKYYFPKRGYNKYLTRNEIKNEKMEQKELKHEIKEEGSQEPKQPAEKS